MPYKHKLLEQLAGHVSEDIYTSLGRAAEIVVEDWDRIPDFQEAAESRAPFGDVLIPLTDVVPGTVGYVIYSETVGLQEVGPVKSLSGWLGEGLGVPDAAMLLLLPGFAEEGADSHAKLAPWGVGIFFQPETHVWANFSISPVTPRVAGMDPDEREQYEQDMKQLWPLLAGKIARLFQFLNADNVELAPSEPAPVKLNRKREKKGKPPIEPSLEVRIYTKGKRRPTSNPQTAGAGTGTKKRRHQTRAHYRHFYRGEKLDTPIAVSAYWSGEAQTDGERWYHVI